MSSSRPPEAAALPVPPSGLSRLLPRSLTTRLIWTTLLLVALVSAVVAAVTTVALRHYLMSRLDSQLTTVAAQRDTDPDAGRILKRQYCALTGWVHPGPGPSSWSVTSGDVVARADASCRSALLVRDYPKVPLSLRGADLTTLLAAAGPEGGSPTTVRLSDGDYRVLAVPDEYGAEVVVGLPMSDLDDTVHSLILWETAVALGGVALAAGLGQLLVRHQLQPLRKVAATATNVTRLPLAAGEVGVIDRVPAELTDPGTEVGQVGSAFNAMIGHVERALGIRHESEQRVRQFLADASHELRTPLSTIKGYAELGRRTPSDPKTMSHALLRIQSESSRMTALVEDLLLLARLDSGRPLERGDVDLSMLLAETVNDARVVSPDRAWRLALPRDAVHVVGDRGRLQQVVTNLLGNAVRHTPPGTTVWVGASTTGGVGELPPGVRLEIRDDGPGIPPSLAGREFERFTRGDPSRTRDAGGSGLGLSIVRAIVAAHGGSAGIASRPGDTVITIWLPAPS